MTLCRLDELERWFDEYTGRFFGQDEYVNLHVRLKQEHTRRTREETLYLAGRLIEYSSLRTFNDTRLCQIGRVYDMNFPASLERLKSRDVLGE